MAEENERTEEEATSEEQGRQFVSWVNERFAEGADVDTITDELVADNVVEDRDLGLAFGVRRINIEHLDLEHDAISKWIEFFVVPRNVDISDQGLPIRRKGKKDRFSV